MNEIKVKVPGTIANISCGYDILGIALHEPSDVMTLKKTDNHTLSIIHKDDFGLPEEVENNVAGVALKSIWEESGKPFGVEMTIEKRIKPGSGLGSSAASAAGAVYGYQCLTDIKMDMHTMVRHAMQGEVVASGNAHADNVAPALMGGMTAVVDYHPLRIVSIPAKHPLYVSVIHPHLEIKTSQSREILNEKVEIKDMVSQMGRAIGLSFGIAEGNYDLIRQCMKDVVVEPLRGQLIPDFYLMRERALQAGALGFAIAGAGPSVFALSQTQEIAEQVLDRMQEPYRSHSFTYDTYISYISVGASIIK